MPEVLVRERRPHQIWCCVEYLSKWVIRNCVANLGSGSALALGYPTMDRREHGESLVLTAPNAVVYDVWGTLACPMVGEDCDRVSMWRSSHLQIQHYMFSRKRSNNRKYKRSSIEDSVSRVYHKLEASNQANVSLQWTFTSEDYGLTGRRTVWLTVLH